MIKNFLKYILISYFLYQNFCFGNDIFPEEKKMRELASELRCVVCQNQSLLESDSELAADLKSLILEMFQEGKTKKEIKNFLVERYGEFILFRPSLNLNNLALWLAPVFSLLIVSLLAYRKLNFDKRKN